MSEPHEGCLKVIELAARECDVPPMKLFANKLAAYLSHPAPSPAPGASGMPTKEDLVYASWWCTTAMTGAPDCPDDWRVRVASFLGRIAAGELVVLRADDALCRQESHNDMIAERDAALRRAEKAEALLATARGVLGVGTRDLSEAEKAYGGTLKATDPARSE